MHYYNEIDKHAVAWLRELMADKLIPQGEIDTRSIRDVQPDDLRGFVQCHFFAGIGGWPYALRLAGWSEDREVWTGSCPCQPFSCAGSQQGESDPRHLWPDFFRLINAVRPSTIFGEQVASKAALGWIDGVFADLEGADYACTANDLCSPCVGAPNIRQRLYWMAHAERDGGRADQQGRGSQGRTTDGHGRLAHTELRGHGDIGNGTTGRGESERDGGMGDADNAGSQGRNGAELSECAQQLAVGAGVSQGFWSDTIWHQCRDGKSRRIPKPQILGMVDGLSIFVVRGGLIYAKEILRSLRDRNPVQEQGQRYVLAAAVLLSAVSWELAQKSQPKAEQLLQICTEAFQSFGVLGLWEVGKTTTASYRSKPTKQLTGKRKGSVRAVSCGYTRLGWNVGDWPCTPEHLHYVWETILSLQPPEAGQDLRSILPLRLGFPLCTEKVEGRVGLLRGYGNAINPQLAAQFIRAAIEAITP